MAQLIEIRKLTFGPVYATATIQLDPSAPLYTSDDIDGTARVYNLLPDIIDHVCIGDAGDTFRDAMGDTELAHLMEHVTVELMARTGIGSQVSCGRTWSPDMDRRIFDIQVICSDDVLCAGALSSAAWILQWAYTGGKTTRPNIDAIVQGLKSLVEAAEKKDAAGGGKQADDEVRLMEQTSSRTTRSVETAAFQPPSAPAVEGADGDRPGASEAADDEGAQATQAMPATRPEAPVAKAEEAAVQTGTTEGNEVSSHQDEGSPDIDQHQV